METKEYNEYVKRWEDYLKREKEYINKRIELIKGGKENLLPALDERYGHDESSLYQFGPFTEIQDPVDLLNPNFILPGIGCSFLQLQNTDHKIPFYFGKRLWSELDRCDGIVIGYAYDSGDDYIQIQLDSGEKKYILVNSVYKVEE